MGILRLLSVTQYAQQCSGTNSKRFKKEQERKESDVRVCIMHNQFDCVHIHATSSIILLIIKRDRD